MLKGATTTKPVWLESSPETFQWPDGVGVDKMVSSKVQFSRDSISDLCGRYCIRKLSLFGSVLRDDFGPESDVDVLIKFDPDNVPGFFALARLERELSDVLGGRKVDVRTPEDLSRYFRDRVVREAEVQYATG